MFSIVVARTDTDIAYAALRRHPGFERLKLASERFYLTTDIKHLNVCRIHLGGDGEGNLRNHR
jgi:hypothetical protein